MQTADFYLNLLLALLVVFLSMCIIWPIRGLVRRVRKHPPTNRLTAWIWRVAGLLSILNIIYIMGLLAIIMTLGQGAFAQGVPPVVIALYTLPLVGLLLTLVLVALIVLAWKNRSGAVMGRVYTSLIVVAALAFSWFLSAFDLLGYQF